jgi:hypothetical protein
MRRGWTSVQICGHTFLKLGLGRDAVRPAVVARPEPREGLSPVGIPLLKLEALKREAMDLTFRKN